jgi:hypothetical protein
MGLQLLNSLDFYSRVDQNRKKQIGRETAVGKIKRRGKHEHSEQLTEVVGVAVGANQGCSDGNTAMPSGWRQDHGGDPHYPKTTTMPFKLWHLHSVHNKKNK